MKTQGKTNKFIIGGLIALVGIAVVVGLFAVFNRGREQAVPAMPPPGDTWPTEAWKTSTPEEQGLDSAKLAEGLLAIREKGTRIHSLLVIRDGRLFLDAYFYPYDGSTVHDMASVTKSVTTTLIGIAVDQGVLSLDDPMLSFFPDVTITYPDPRLEKVTVRDLAMMANGLESTGVAQDEATLAEMESSSDWLKTAVDRPMAYNPGTKFVYDSPGMHILSGILQNKTGMTELEFARQYLFGPLGIKNVIWPVDPQGYTHGFGNICLHPRDAARIGYLWLNQGMWDGQQIVSSQWVAETFKTQMKTEMGDNYSYGWWTTENDGVVETIFALGRGGQYIRVVPFANVVIVVTGSNLEYNEIEPYILAAVVDLESPLPPNPQGVAKLGRALKIIQQAPPAQAVPALPEMARMISGKTYLFEPNPTHIQSIRFDFDDSAEAGMEMLFDHTAEKYSGKIGLDGVFRLTPGENGLPAGLRGRWDKADKFIMDLETIANREAFIYVIQFNGDQIAVEIREGSHETGITITGTAET
jgi:CubicO group peptidase (beta-lactamase class C family)